tara:strand:+ start:851 stop:1120 length:270 start_codon:yes stop_codon:yes gene_type:complete
MNKNTLHNKRKHPDDPISGPPSQKIQPKKKPSLGNSLSLLDQSQPLSAPPLFMNSSAPGGLGGGMMGGGFSDNPMDPIGSFQNRKFNMQ